MMFTERYKINNIIQRNNTYESFYCTLRNSNTFTRSLEIFSKNVTTKKDYFELALLLSHNNIGKVHDFFFIGDKIYVISEIVAGQNILDRVVRLSSYSEKNSVKFIKIILGAIKYLSQRGIFMINVDLKCINFTNKKDSSLKLSIYTQRDSGFFGHLSQTLGSYCAPEILLNQEVHLRTNLWTLGIFLSFLLTGREPFHDPRGKILTYRHILECDLKIEHCEKITDAGIDLLGRLLVKSPKDRISYNQIDNHPWFTIGRKGKPKLTHVRNSFKEMLRLDETKFNSKSTVQKNN